MITHNSLKKKQSLYFVLFFLFFFTGCANLPSTNSSLFQTELTKDANYYLTESETKQGREKIDWILLATQALIKENNAEKAQTLLDSLPQIVRLSQSTERRLLGIELNILNKQYDKATTALNQVIKRQLNGIQVDRFYRAKVTILNAQKPIDYPQLLDTYVQWEESGSPKYKKQVVRETWKQLNRMTESDFSAFSGRNNSQSLLGWLALSSLYKEQKGNKGTWNAQYDHWLKQYPNHPAATFLLESANTGLGTGQRDKPVATGKIDLALLLPLSGGVKSFGENIEKGFNDSIRANPIDEKVSVTTYDTNKLSIESILSDIKKRGIKFIVGPLLKDDVIELANYNKTIPTLALNHVNRRFQKNMCYFSLSPEDEAAAAARRMALQGKQSPLVLVVEGEFGQRVAREFAKQWHISTGLNTARVHYFDSVQTLMARLKTKRALEGNPILSNSAAETGNDNLVDAVYIVSTNDDLRLIKPLIDARSQQYQPIAIYASSRANIANTSRNMSLSLEGVELTEIPFIAKQASKQFGALPSSLKQDFSSVRLYALGYDAWSLSKEFNQLTQMGSMPALVGLLSRDESCIIRRDLDWLTYSEGELIPAN